MIKQMVLGEYSYYLQPALFSPFTIHHSPSTIHHSRFAIWKRPAIRYRTGKSFDASRLPRNSTLAGKKLHNERSTLFTKKGILIVEVLSKESE
jgi:hypothetical protein